MPSTRNPYLAEFRERIVALAKAGRGIASLAQEFEPCVATIHGCANQARIDGGTSTPSSAHVLWQSAAGS